MSNESIDAMRADVWLWVARFFKTRSLAKQAIGSGKISVNDLRCKPAKTLCVGDSLRISRAEECIEIEILALSVRRGSALVAQALYRETETSRSVREVQREQRRLLGAGYAKPASRPDKQARRALRQLKSWNES